MTRYIAVRLLWVAVLLLAASILTFAVFYLLPSGDPATLRAGRDADPLLVAQIRHQLGLDEPWPAQLGEYLRRLVMHFDLGYSYQSNTPVRSEILQRLPATLSLALGAVIIAFVTGVIVGVASALRPGRLLDRTAMAGAALAISAPVYWLGLVSLYLFAEDIGHFKLLPGAGAYAPLTEDPVRWLGSMLLPWLVLAAPLAGVYARLLRSTMIATLSEEYIRATRAKGVRRRVVLRHALRAAITPVVTAIGIDLASLLGGVVLIESVFDIPGIGRLAFEATQQADLPMIEGTVLFGVFLIVTANLVVDLLYAVLDPRVRY